MTPIGLASLLIALASANEPNLLDTWLHPERLAAIERSTRAELAALGCEFQSERERLATRLLDLWTCLAPDPNSARALLATFDFGDSGMRSRAPRLLAHRLRLEGRLADAHDVERRIRHESGLDPTAALIVAVELRSIPTPEAAGECHELLTLVADALPAHATPTYLAVDFARNTNRCDEAVARLDRFGRLARSEGRHEAADWALGLAAEIEARDLARPRAAATRCERWFGSAADAASRSRAESFVEWYSRGVAESVRSEAQRDRLRTIAFVTALALASTLASAGITMRRGRR